MNATPLLDSILLGLFRYRTRGFMRMTDCDGTVPPRPRSGGTYLYVHIPFLRGAVPVLLVPPRAALPAAGEALFHRAASRARALPRGRLRIHRRLLRRRTPTVEPEELLETIALVRTRFAVKEISVETNPRDLRPDLLAQLRAGGVTRLSVGVQSFDDTLLREMGRFEKYGGGAETAERIRGAAGLFPTLNVDLIFNQPHQTLASLERDLDIFQTLGAGQVFLLSADDLASGLRRLAGAMGVPDRRRLRQFYQTIGRRLAAGGFAPTSAWCFTRNGQGSDEYIATADNYVGAGSGAFSYLDGTLYSTSFSLNSYEERIARGLTGIVTRHQLGDTDRMRYALLVRMFGLGLDRAWAHQASWPEIFPPPLGRAAHARGARRGDARRTRLAPHREGPLLAHADDGGILRVGERLPRRDARARGRRAGRDRPG